MPLKNRPHRPIAIKRCRFLISGQRHEYTINTRDTKMKNLLGKLLICCAFVVSLHAMAETPDELVRDTSRQVLDAQTRQWQNTKNIRAEVEALVLPKFDFTRMTALAVGRGVARCHARPAKQLTDQFRMLLVCTYSSTMTRFKNAQITVQASNPAADAREVTASDVELPANAGDKRSAQVDYTLIKTHRLARLQCQHRRRQPGDHLSQQLQRHHLRQGGPDALIQSLKDKTTPCPVASMPATDDGLTLALSGPVTFAHTARLARAAPARGRPRAGLVCRHPGGFFRRGADSRTGARRWPRPHPAPAAGWLCPA